MHPRQESPMQFVVVVTLISVLFGCWSAAWANDAEKQWSAKYIAGSKKSNQHSDVKLSISGQSLVCTRGKSTILEIPAASIAKVGYDTSSHNRGWAWLKAAPGPRGAASGGGTSGGDVFGVRAASSLVTDAMATVALGGAAILSPFKSTQHFVRILWDENGTPAEALFEVGKDNYQGVLTELQKLSGKPWVDLPEERKRLVSELEAARQRKVPLSLTQTVVLNEAELKSGQYQLVLLEGPDNYGAAYFFSGEDADPHHVVTQAVVRIEGSSERTTSPEVSYVEEQGVQTIAVVGLPDKKLVFTAPLPVPVETSARSFYGNNGRWASVSRSEYRGEQAYRFHVLHRVLSFNSRLCQEFVYVSRGWVASEIAPNSPRSGCPTFSAARADVKAVATKGSWANWPDVKINIADKTYDFLPLFEGGKQGLTGKTGVAAKVLVVPDLRNAQKEMGLPVGTGDAAGEYVTFFALAVNDFDAVDNQRQSSPASSPKEYRAPVPIEDHNTSANRP